MNDKSRQLAILIVSGLAVIGIIAVALYLSTESAAHKTARLRDFTATLPSFAAQPVLPGTAATGSCPSLSDRTDLPALVSRRSDDSTDNLSVQADFIAATANRGFTWQGTSGYAYTLATYKDKTYRISFPSDDATVAIMVTACD